MPLTLRRVLLLSVAALMLFAGAYRLSDSSAGVGAAGVGGPVILGGDDMTDHGSVAAGDAQDGWLYIQRAIESIGPNVTRAGNDGSIAALGSAAGSVATSSDAGAAIDLAGSKTGRTVTHYEGAAAIDTFFTDLASATAKPAIIHLAGNGAPNDFDPSEEARITAHAAEIASFVSSGGGLLSHGTYYDWLTALLPGATAVSSGGSDLYFTADGLTDLPGLTVGNINAGPWHNHFEGDFGGLKVLVRDEVISDSSQHDAAVIIGGAKVTFETPAPETPTVEASATTPRRLKTHTPTRTATAAPTSTTTPVPPANTPAASATAAQPSPTGGRGGVIVGPNTGDGPGGGASRTPYLLTGAMLAVAGIFAGSIGRKLRQ